MLPKFSVNRPVTVLMVVLAVIVLGFVSLGNTNIDLMPSLTLPMAVVMTQYPGAAPSEVENMVTKPIEGAVATVSGVDTVTSTSSMGQSLVMVQFAWGTDMDFASLNMREKIDLVKGFLPQDVQAPTVIKMDPSLLPVVQIAVTGELDKKSMQQLVDETIIPRLERIDGVASVSTSGEEERQIKVNLDQNKLANYNLTPQQVLQVLQANNLNYSAGSVKRGTQDLLVRVNGEFRNVDDIANLLLVTSTGSTLRLKDIATVEDGVNEATSLAKVNGKDAVSISVSKATDANTVAVSDEVIKTMEEIKNELPAQVEMATVFDQAEYIRLSINNVIQNLILGGILAALIIYVFLRRFVPTLIISFSMPIAVVVTFLLIYFNHMTLNIMTLGGLALGIGMMVDNSIVVVENIFRHKSEGEDLTTSSIDGANEVGTAITASTLTTIAVFLPIGFVGGITSEIFTDLSLTVGFALVSSLFVALTLVPMLSSRLLSFSQAPEETKGWFYNLSQFYKKILEWCLNKRWAVIGIITLVLLGCIVLAVTSVKTEFMPKVDQGIINATVEVPPGTSLEETESILTKVEDAFLKYPEVDTVYTNAAAGTGGASAQMTGFAVSAGQGSTVMMTLKPLSERTKSSEEAAAQLRKEIGQIPGAKITISPLDMTSMMVSGAGSPVMINIKGDDLDTLKDLSENIVNILNGVPGLKNIKTSLEEARPEIIVTVDRDKANSLGLTPAQIGSALRLMINGQTATQYREAGKEFDLVVALEKGMREHVGDLESLILTTPTGAKVPLKNIAQITEEEAPLSIQREDQARSVSVTADLEGVVLGEVMPQVQSLLAQKLVLPAGYELSYGGEQEMMNDVFKDLTFALLLAIALIYMVMASQFESLLHPFVIMFCLPITAIGVILALFLTGQSFNVLAFVGVIVLAGIVVNNGIVLIDFTNQLRRSRGMKRDEALLAAGPIRMRPVLMTALTTIIGMLPLALGLGGEGAEMQQPMAITIIGGLLSATFLTLVFIPVIYSLFDEWGEKITKRIKWLQRKEEIENEN